MSGTLALEGSAGKQFRFHVSANLGVIINKIIFLMCLTTTCHSKILNDLFVCDIYDNSLKDV